MNSCLTCGKPIEQKDKTRRTKKFCNDLCRATYHQKKNAGKKKYVRIETFEAVKNELEELKKGKLVSAKIVKENGNTIAKIQVTVNEKPKRIEGESGIDYSIRLAEWKKNN